MPTVQKRRSRRENDGREENKVKDCDVFEENELYNDVFLYIAFIL